MAVALALQAQSSVADDSAREPRTWQGSSFRFVYFPDLPGGAPGSVRLRCRVRDSGRLIGCRYSEASDHEYGAYAIRSAHNSRIVIQEGGPQGGDYVEFRLVSAGDYRSLGGGAVSNSLAHL